jgi:23S rRNA (cytosine1962-C5)-methyltransferase
VITEYGIKFRADPAGAHKTGFFADQRENREWLSQQVEGKSVLDLCCNTGGFAVYAAARGASKWSASTSMKTSSRSPRAIRA